MSHAFNLLTIAYWFNILATHSCFRPPILCISPWQEDCMSKHNEIVAESGRCVVSSSVLMFTLLLLSLSGRSLPEPCPPCPLSIWFHGEWLCCWSPALYIYGTVYGTVLVANDLRKKIKNSIATDFRKEQRPGGFLILSAEL